MSAMTLQSLQPLPDDFYRLELSFFLPKFRKVLLAQWNEVACFLGADFIVSADRKFDCINDYGVDLVPILGYIDPTSDLFQEYLELTHKMFKVESPLQDSLALPTGMSFLQVSTLLPLVFATKVYQLWYKLFEEAVNKYYEYGDLRTTDGSPKDSGEQS
jgi:hypothetical protein|tara:strand:- start:421 stop:897 length:477 start_codon:yes stop_codon:yes gene_type:complete